MLMRIGETGGVSTSRNLLLRTLRADDYGLLSPHMAVLDVARGDVLIRLDAPLERLYFPENATVVVEETIAEHCHVESAVVGHEGMLGWPALLGCETSAHSAVVQGQGGRVVGIALRPLLEACRASGSLWQALLCFVQVVMVQMARAIASHLDNSLDQRIARWLLMRHDRIIGDQLLVRHDEISDGLNARRASVTDRLHVLEGERLVRCRRGRLFIRDREGLERFAGDAYGSAEAQYRRLIAPFGKSIGKSLSPV